MARIPSPLIILAAGILLLTGCHSSRNATPSKGYAAKSPRKELTVPQAARQAKGDAAKLVAEAEKWLGTPYRYGGQDRSGTDCSGLTMQLYRNALGMKIPRNSREQQRFCQPVPYKHLITGDLVFFCTGSDPKRISHVGMYMGDGKFIHSSTSKGVIISDMSERYYTQRYHSSGCVKRRGRMSGPSETAPVVLEAPPSLQQQFDKAVEAAADSIFGGFFD